MAQQAVEEVATGAPLYNGAAMGRAPAAQPGRDENSMLFSLSALTAKAATTAAASSSSKTSATKEDSGVIDLKALANSAGAPAQSSGASDFMADHGSLFPLGAPIAAPAPASISIPLPPPAPSKTPIFIGIGVAVASLAIVGAFFAMKGSDKPPPVETVQTAAPPPPPTVEAAPPPTATVEASAAPSASAKKPGPRWTGTGKPSTGTGGASTAAAGATAAPTAKPNKCGCAPGDLMCAMKCSAGGK